VTSPSASDAAPRSAGRRKSVERKDQPGDTDGHTVGTLVAQRYIEPSQLEDGQSVASGVLQCVVVVHGGHAKELKMPGRKENGHGVIVAGITVDEDLRLGMS